ncbi:MAG: VWA domain-containing protein [Planctomycetota bacterium]
MDRRTRHFAPSRATRAIAVGLALLVGLVAFELGPTESSLARPMPVAHAQVGGCSVVAGSIGFYGQTFSATTVVWAIDLSGSMSGSRLATLKQELTMAIQSLQPNQRFGIVGFSSSLTVFQTVVVPATATNQQSAIAWVQSLTATGSTCTAPGGVRALEIANASPDVLRRVILVTDGVPNCPGIAETLAAIAAANTQGIPIDGIYLAGDALGVAFLQQLVSENGGQFYH